MMLMSAANDGHTCASVQLTCECKGNRPCTFVDTHILAQGALDTGASIYHGIMTSPSARCLQQS